MSNGGWTGSGFGEWEWGAPVPGVYELCDTVPRPEPTGAYSGNNAWATNLNGCYANSGAESLLVSQTFDFSAVQAPIDLNWQNWYEIFTTFDKGEVYVNGTMLWQVTSSTATADWLAENVDLSAYAGQANVTVTFRLFATTVVNRMGWYVDDVEILGCIGGGEPPNINVSPLSMASTQATNTSTNQQLTIANTGGGTLDWVIDEEDTTAFPPGPAVVDSASAFEDANAVAAPGAPQPAPEGTAIWRAPEAVLWDNGPLVNYPGAGAGGADESRLQSASLSMTTLGFGHQVLNNNWIADDFTVGDASGWTVNTATFFAYQTNSTTTSTMTNVNWILYNGDPSAGGTVITSGSGLQTSVFANIYRTTETTIGVTNRPIMATTVNMGGLFLPAGTYWLAWQTDGTLSSGPWAPPITINGQTTTGNGLQSLAGTASWAPANDGGTLTRQGFPFILEGTVGGTGQACSALSDIAWLSLSAANGSNAGGTNTQVTVTFNSTGLANGVYTGNLCVTSNDPDAGPGNGTDLVIVPLTLTVQPPTAVTLDGLAAENSASPAGAGVPLGALPAAAAAAFAAVYALRRRR